MCEQDSGYYKYSKPVNLSMTQLMKNIFSFVTVLDQLIFMLYLGLSQS